MNRVIWAQRLFSSPKKINRRFLLIDPYVLTPPLTVSVDGVELNDVSFFSVMPQWSSVVKTLPVSISPSGVLC